MKRIKPYLLSSFIGISAVTMSVAGLFYQNTVYCDRSFSFLEEPPVMASMLALSEDSLLAPFSSEVNVAAMSTDYFKDITFVDSSLFDTDNWKEAPLEFTKVTEDYFDDAVFIGDSRTSGIAAYAGLTNATFYSATSLNIFDFDKRKISIDGSKKTIKEALSEHQFKKVYIMIGINDVGISTVDTFYNTYADVIREISRLQPDALIFIEANLHVTKKKSEQDKTINNENIEMRNQEIASLADQKRIFYIDVNKSSLCDKDGNLKEEYTWDQVHLEAKYYPVWKEFLMKNGIVISKKS